MSCAQNEMSGIVKMTPICTVWHKRLAKKCTKPWAPEFPTFIQKYIFTHLVATFAHFVPRKFYFGFQLINFLPLVFPGI